MVNTKEVMDDLVKKLASTGHKVDYKIKDGFVTISVDDGGIRERVRINEDGTVKFIMVDQLTKSGVTFKRKDDWV